jgi:tetratricopeptide (TPR) repeat protein
MERLREGRKEPRAGKEAAPSDSLEASIARQVKFEAQASELLHIAEIDLLELDQPLVALREFEQVLREYPGSLQCPRAAFAMAWIYDHKLRDAERARQAYETLARDYADTPQGREARAILEGKARGPEVMQPSTQP